MKNEMKRKRWRLLTFIFAGFIFILAGFIVTLHIIIPGKLRQQLGEMSPELRISYSSLHINLFASAVTLNNLDIAFTPDSTRKEFSHHLHFSEARLKEINFLKLAISKIFSAGAIELEKADISLDSSLLEKNDPVMNQAKLKLPFKKAFISGLRLRDAKIYLYSNGSKKLIAEGDISVNDIN